ncbi:nucleotidyltransferase family protein [Pseudomonas sp. dw_358]|uniref:nucleotidyltransferase family protein n=1 Tax=Pseudomonas sp. dw_358 TaxID=2720083 RepID=UPI001BD50A37|nr:nucleotidyltransferase family protein [Pseudomonas sp. dw_358]
MTVTAVVLAAGLGSRFREVAGAECDKLLASCVGLDGVSRPVLQQVLMNVSAVADRCIVVTRPNAPGRIALANEFGCAVVLLDSAGMGDSLAAAVAASAGSRGWLVTLGDMPWVAPQTFAAVVDGLQPRFISLPLGEQGRGHPVCFGASFAAGLMALSGDHGGKRLFTADNVREVRVDDEGIYRDVDTPADL